MAKEIIIELRNGQHFQAFWAKPFVPAEKEVAVILADSKERRVFQLSSVSCILMPELLLPEMQAQQDDPYEIIECVTDRIFHVHVLKAHTCPGGFFAVPVDKSSSLQLIFSTEGGIRSRTKKAPLGKILEEQGLFPRIISSRRWMSRSA